MSPTLISQTRGYITFLEERQEINNDIDNTNNCWNNGSHHQENLIHRFALHLHSLNAQIKSKAATTAH